MTPELSHKVCREPAAVYRCLYGHRFLVVGDRVVVRRRVVLPSSVLYVVDGTWSVTGYDACCPCNPSAATVSRAENVAPARTMAAAWDIGGIEAVRAMPRCSDLREPVLRILTWSVVQYLSTLQVSRYEWQAAYYDA